ncbi:hypothetical protein NDN08_000022 [Rhodosorus marinus]|uniref:PSII 6.1 kDa protein n=1 Tax=Rhodosorus marinus TaxID=101924 RepID=A0AAV8UGW6_9RHOD|nr:hypothetical protein NDN08_000022 [Rhodosorus marinus]
MNTAFVNGVTPLTTRAVGRSVSVKKTTVMKMDVKKLAVMIPAIVPSVAHAAEGTGAGLGIDNVLLYLPLVLIPTTFFFLFIGFGRSQDNTDFFGDFDGRRN